MLGTLTLPVRPKGEVLMKKQLITTCAIALSSSLLFAQDMSVIPKVIYGDDNRVDVIDSNNPLFVKLALSTAAQIDKSKITVRGADAVLAFESLERGMGVCPTEKFAAQNSIARCSGFLIAKDLLVTAGHCVRSQEECEKYSWVFDYREGEVDDGKLPSSSVYNCKKIINQALDPISDADYALIKLDRKVKDRKPLKFRKKGSPEVGDELVVIGHPSGLTTKVSDGAKVIANDADQYILTDLDTYGGNSGSAVFNTSKGTIEGILVRGARDYIYDWQQGCYVSNVCDSVGGAGCEGEEVSRISKVQLKKFTGIIGFFKRLFGLL
ncbi:MAG: peptidase [Halobacteriovorax sp.]|nr:peptidase [Halobacteriovorax sp.]|tara:strand:- start:4332 stop:5303 length:972 start_codon:yes stop_codon:yes gene_type:complete